jgi:hypothetical protein
MESGILGANGFLILGLDTTRDVDHELKTGSMVAEKSSDQFISLIVMSH